MLKQITGIEGRAYAIAAKLHGAQRHAYIAKSRPHPLLRLHQLLQVPV